MATGDTNSESRPSPPRRNFIAWIEKRIESGRPGSALPTQKQLAERFDLSRETVRRILKEYRDRGKLCSIPGKGTFLFPAERTEVTGDEPVRRGSTQQLTEELVRSINRGVLKRGQALPQVKTVQLQFHVSTATVIRAYRNLESRGLVSRIGKRYWVGGFSIRKARGTEKYVYLYHTPDFDCTSLFNDPRTGFALREVEQELQACGVRLRFMEYADLVQFMNRGHMQHREAPLGMIVIWVTRERYDELLRWHRRRRRTTPIPNMLFVGTRVPTVDRLVHYFLDGTIHTSRARELVRYCVEKNYSRVSVLFNPRHSAQNSLRDIIRLMPELLHVNKDADIAFHILDKPPESTADYLLKHLTTMVEHIGDYLHGILSKYRETPVEELCSRISFAPNPSALFSRAKESSPLWICTDDRTASMAVSWCREHRVAIPREVGIMGIQNRPDYYEYGISACVPDWRSIGYLMAHAVMGDIAVERTRRGYLRTPVTILERLTTP